jgi:hypothetical protein
MASAQALRAALLFNFIKFTEWPAATVGEDKLWICIASSNPVQIEAIEALADRQIRGKSLATVVFSSQTNCHVIYVDTRERWHEIARKHISRQALTIGSYPGFVAEGGMIEISLQDGNTRFEINLPAAKRAGLRIYPQLLRLARRVVE